MPLAKLSRVADPAAVGELAHQLWVLPAAKELPADLPARDQWCAVLARRDAKPAELAKTPPDAETVYRLLEDLMTNNPNAEVRDAYLRAHGRPLVQDLRKGFAVLLGVPVAPQGEFGRGSHQRHRRPQFVRRVGGEARDSGEHRVKALQHCIQRLR